MQIRTALLCDHASVREGLLTVVGGGITRLWRVQLPAKLNVSVALMLALNRLEAANPHEIRMVVQDEDGEQRAEVQGGLQVGEVRSEVGEDILVPFAIPLAEVTVEHYGSYSVEILVDGVHQVALQFRVLHSDDKPGANAPPAEQPPPSQADAPN